MLVGVWQGSEVGNERNRFLWWKRGKVEEGVDVDVDVDVKVIEEDAMLEIFQDLKAKLKIYGKSMQFKSFL